jgi:hypothetical protein
MFAVIGVCPSTAMLWVSATFMSSSVVFAQDELIVVPVTTGLPAGSTYVPLPFLLML